jgi:hypothetical protein
MALRSARIPRLGLVSTASVIYPAPGAPITAVMTKQSTKVTDNPIILATTPHLGDSHDSMPTPRAVAPMMTRMKISQVTNAVMG